MTTNDHPNASPKTVVFVQARTGSSRLPGKILKKVMGREVLLYQIERIRKAKTIDDVVVITTTKPEDDAIAALCDANAIHYYRGSELDLLDRHYQAARTFNADFALKIGSDCPFSDPAVIDQVVLLWKKDPTAYDYVSNVHPATFPDGLDTEGFTFAALEAAWNEAKKSHEREHTTPFFWENPARFRIGNVENPQGSMFVSHRWCLDYPEDFEFVKTVFEELKDTPLFLTADVLALLQKKPHIAEINKKHAGVNWYRNNAEDLKTIPRHMYRTNAALKLGESLGLLERARNVIPCMTQTLSKGYTQWSVGASPLFIKSARGCEVFDVDGNAYIDYGMGLGPFILGYADPDVNAAVSEQLAQGTMFTLPHPLEVEAAELITEVVPCAEMVRFGKNGSDATTAAVKLARAYTGKEKIISCGYHGWHDWYIATTERNKGVPKATGNLTIPMQYNDIESLKKIVAEHKNEIAGLIMEPVYTIEPAENFLEEVRRITREAGIVLIFDEMFSGFRWSMGGAQEYFGVIPDLACFGKAIANGFPVSVIAGKRDIMKEFEDVFFSFTYGGETLSLAAIIATITKLREKKVHEYVWKIGADLKTGVGNLIRKHQLESFISLIGYPVKTAFSFTGTSGIAPLEMKTFFQQECAKRGVLFIGYHLPSFAHKKEDIDFTLEVYDQVMSEFRKAVAEGSVKRRLVGAVVTQIFKNVGDRSSGLGKKDLSSGV